MQKSSQKHIDMLIHVNDASAKQRVETMLAGIPGVNASRVKSTKPNMLFVSYDPIVFDIRAVPEMARKAGIEAQIVEV